MTQTAVATPRRPPEEAPPTDLAVTVLRLITVFSFVITGLLLADYILRLRVG